MCKTLYLRNYYRKRVDEEVKGLDQEKFTPAQIKAFRSLNMEIF